MRTARLLALFAALALLASCRPTARMAYVADAPRGIAYPIDCTYTTTIYPGDLLHIQVYSQEPNAVIPFNEETNRLGTTSQPIGHLVGTDGCILFPILGSINTTGLTLNQLGQRIDSMLIARGLVTDPQTTVDLINFRVTVIGEVRRPQQIHVGSERITLFEALAQCGDITPDGIRSCVTIVRNQDGRQTFDTLDLTSKDILTSPYYYLRQNDILYVEPTPKKKRTAYRNEDWPQYLSTGVAAVRMAYLVIYRQARIRAEAQ